MATERAYWLAWSRLHQVGPVTIKRLWEQFGSLATAWKMSAGDLLTVDGIGLLSAESIVAQRSKINPEALLEKHAQENESFWTPADPDYPALLFAINDPPPVLYYRGNLRLNDNPNMLSVGIVGTRRPSTYGKRWTQRLSGELTRQGAMIVSGLAAGIDTEAHTSCLSRQGLTVAVLGTGVDVVYPYRNTSLYKRIVDTGLVLSEYPDGTKPDKAHFPRRNRIIAGLSRAILVAEAPARSGALITARLANDYCREVYALPCGLDNEQGEGCLRLIAQGAQVVISEAMLIESLGALPPVDVSIAAMGEVLPTVRAIAAVNEETPAKEAEANSDPMVQSGERGASADASTEQQAEQQGMIHIWTDQVADEVKNLSPVLTQVLNAVPAEPMVLDQIVQRSQMETGPLLGALMQLELSGLVVQLPGMQYQRA